MSETAASAAFFVLLWAKIGGLVTHQRRNSLLLLRFLGCVVVGDFRFILASFGSGHIHTLHFFD